jgi:hypothetical protein
MTWYGTVWHDTFLQLRSSAALRSSNGRVRLPFSSWYLDRVPRNPARQVLVACFGGKERSDWKSFLEGNARASNISGDEHGRADRKDDWITVGTRWACTDQDKGRSGGCCAFLPRRKAKKSHFTLVSPCLFNLKACWSRVEWSVKCSGVIQCNNNTDLKDNLDVRQQATIQERC